MLALAVALMIAAGVAGFGLYTHYAQDLPPLDQFDGLLGAGVTRFESADGQLVGEWSQERRVAVRWDQLPRELVLAVLAAEDARFFFHTGVDLRGIARAMLANLKAGSIREGASTITQQLAKTLVGNEKSYARKIREAILARRMDDRYTKQQILTWYLNTVFFGHRSHGIQAAAQNYFRRDVWDLSLAQMAMLVGVLPAPSTTNPAVNMAAARKNMRHVLGQMHGRAWIDDGALAAALAEGETLTIQPTRDTMGDHVPGYTAEVRARIVGRYDAPGEGRSWLDRGLTVSMAVDPALQHLATRSMAGALESLAKRQGYPGPLARLDRRDYFGRIQAQGSPRALDPGTRHLGRVSKVDKETARVELTPDAKGSVSLSSARWATPYTEWPIGDDGRRVTGGKVSLDRKLRDLGKAMAAGDIVWVEVKGGPPAALELELAPIPLMEGALVSWPSHSGGVDTLVGTWDFDRSEVQRTLRHRQTGSLMKPIFYGKAYDMGVPPSAHVSGQAFTEGTYDPSRGKARPDALLWDALARSINPMSLRVLREIKKRSPRAPGGGRDLTHLREWGEALGLGRPLQGNAAEPLGADQTPFDMAQALATFARRGTAPHAALVRKVVDRHGVVLERNMTPIDPHATFGDAILALWHTVTTPQARRIPESTAYLVTSNLEQVIQRGTGKKARKLGREAAGKTGTLPYDVWFGGYTFDRVAVAWIGADKRERALGRSERVNKVTGGRTALPGWLAFMKGVDPSSARPARSMVEKPPDDIVHLRIDRESGLLARKGGIVIPHHRGHVPTEFTPEPDIPQDIEALTDEF